SVSSVDATIGPSGIAVTGAVPADGSFHHVMVTYDGAMAAVYVDGTPRGMTNVSAISYDAVVSLLVGCDRDVGGVGSWFAGPLDDLYVFDHVLDATQLAYLAAP